MAHRKNVVTSEDSGAEPVTITHTLPPRRFCQEKKTVSCLFMNGQTTSNPLFFLGHSKAIWLLV